MILLIDDLRDFQRDRRSRILARDSAEGLAALRAADRIDELWLDHDLGGDDTILPVVEYLEEAAAAGKPIDVGRIFVHSVNPVGAERVRVALHKAGYAVARVNPLDYNLAC